MPESVRREPEANHDLLALGATVDWALARVVELFQCHGPRSGEGRG